MVAQWFIGKDFYADLLALLDMCNLYDLVKEDQDYLKSFHNLPVFNSTGGFESYTKADVITSAYYICYYRCYQSTCECKDLTLLDQIAEQEGVEIPENHLPQNNSTEVHIPFWGGSV